MQIDVVYEVELADSTLGSARPEVRGAAEPYGGAYPPSIPLPRTPHETHHYPIADGRAETDRYCLTTVDGACAPFYVPFEAGECSMPWAPYDELLAPQVKYFPLGW